MPPWAGRGGSPYADEIQRVIEALPGRNGIVRLRHTPCNARGVCRSGSGVREDTVERKVNGQTMKALIERLCREEEGQDLVEYALLAALIATVSVLGLSSLGIGVGGFYQRLSIFFGTI